MIDVNCPIWQAGLGFCWTPSAAWGCSDAELCVKCKAKPRSAETMRDVRHRRTMQAVATVPDRTCRFCGQQNVYRNRWRAKDRMCRRAACWQKFLEELKFAI